MVEYVRPRDPGCFNLQKNCKKLKRVWTMKVYFFNRPKTNQSISPGNSHT